MANTKKTNSKSSSRAKSRPYAKSKNAKAPRSVKGNSYNPTPVVKEADFEYGIPQETAFYASGDAIRELRISHGYTQSFVAEKLGVTPGYISNVENNRTQLSLKHLAYYAELLNMTIDSFVGKTSADYKETSLDNELADRISHLTEEEKEKLLQIIDIVFNS